MGLEFSSVYQVVTKYYPIGDVSSDSKYSQHSGVALINELRMQSDHQKWSDFVRHIKQTYSKILEVEFDSGSVNPSYSGSLLLVDEKMGAASYTRKLRFNLSMLAPAYTVYGIDSITLNTSYNHRLNFEPILFISPLDVYEEWFALIRKQIEQTYQSAQYVPFSLFKLRVPSLSVGGAIVQHGEDPSVFQALFSGEDITSYRYVGNILYE